MTDKTILTPAEALRALSEGKRLTCVDWEGEFVHLSDENIRYQDGLIYEGDFANFSAFTEPKPKVV